MFHFSRDIDRMFRDMDRSFGFPRMHSMWRDYDALIDDFFDRDLMMLPAPQEQQQPQQQPQQQQEQQQPAPADSKESKEEAKSEQKQIQAATSAPQQLASWRPTLKSIRVDVVEKPDKFIVNAEVPGIPKEQLKLQLNDGVLTISGERKEEKKEEKENYVRHECSYGQVSRSLRLPKNVDGKKVSAKYENGVLSVELPKSEESKPMDVAIA